MHETIEDVKGDIVGMIARLKILRWKVDSVIRDAEKRIAKRERQSKRK